MIDECLFFIDYNYFSCIKKHCTEYQTWFVYYNQKFDKLLNSNKCFKLNKRFYTITYKEIQDSGCGCCGAKYQSFFVEGFQRRYGPWKRYTADVSFYYLGCKKFGVEKSDEDSEDEWSNVLFKIDFAINRFLHIFLPKKLKLIDKLNWLSLNTSHGNTHIFS